MFNIILFIMQNHRCIFEIILLWILSNALDAWLDALKWMLRFMGPHNNQCKYAHIQINKSNFVGSFTLADLCGGFFFSESVCRVLRLHALGCLSSLLFNVKSWSMSSVLSLNFLRCIWFFCVLFAM